MLEQRNGLCALHHMWPIMASAKHWMSLLLLIIIMLVIHVKAWRGV